MRLLTPLLAAAAVAAGAAAPAHAADLSLDVMAHGTITTRSSLDTGTASEVLDASVDLEHQLRGLWLPEGAREAAGRFESQRLFATKIGADYTMETPGRTLRWTCSTAGEATGVAGEVRVRRDGGDLLLEVGIQDSLEGNAACSGDNEAGSSYRLVNAPYVAKLRVPQSALADGSEVVTVRDLIGTCTQGGTCQTVFNGSVVLRTADDPGGPEQPGPQPGQPGTPGAPAGPAKPAKSPKPKVRVKRTKQGAKVTVTCGPGCGGRISALAVAQRKQLAAKPFRTGAGASKAVVLRFPKHKGGVVIDVRATPRGGAPSTRTVRLPR